MIQNQDATPPAGEPNAPNFAAAERCDWSDSLMELAEDALASEGDIDGEDVETLARAYLALRAEVERLTRKLRLERSAAEVNAEWNGKLSAQLAAARGREVTLIAARVERAVITEFERNFPEQSEHEEDCEFSPCRCDREIQGIVKIHNASRRNFLGQLEVVVTRALTAALSAQEGA